THDSFEQRRNSDVGRTGRLCLLGYQGRSVCSICSGYFQYLVGGNVFTITSRFTTIWHCMRRLCTILSLIFCTHILIRTSPRWAKQPKALRKKCLNGLSIWE